MSNWDREVDTLVVGSGAGGLMSALVAASNGADVLIVEKASLWGGTSATSGGGIWIPGSDLARAAGFEDNLEDAFRYIRGLSADNVPDANIRAYITHAAPMLRWLMDHTQIRYAAMPYPDYHAENPGGSPAGYRTHMPDSIDGKSLGADVRTMRFASPAASLFGYLNWSFEETHQLLFKAKGWRRTLAVLMSRYWLDLPFRLTSRKDRRLTLGNALVGGLRLKLNALGVPLWLEAPLKELVRDKDRVTGAVVEKGGKPYRIGVRKGVVLAGGGFDKNQAMRQANTPLYPDAAYSGGVSSNTGDTILAGQAIGAAAMNLHSTWAAPVFHVPGEDRGRLSTAERALPGCIMINQTGERYLNEAGSYHVVGQAMARRQAEYGDAKPGWMIFDAEYRRKLPMGPLYPGIPSFLHKKGVRSILKKGRSIEELARAIGMDSAVLSATIARFNTHAAKGEDPQFHRGEATYDKMYGDLRNGPNPCLRPLTVAPYYAMPIYPGDIGTNGGLAADARGRVMDEAGRVIPGLYAVGNNAASAMGESYPGAGVTLGPALTFGYLAACDMTNVNA